MEVILTNRCISFTGSLGFGYSIQRRKDRFFGKRDSKGIIPLDGHWRFIVACAEMAMMEVHISDILITAKELREALDESGFIYGFSLQSAKNDKIFHASEVLDMRKRWGL